MIKQDIRWIQRFSNYNKALQQLQKNVEYIKNNIITTEKENTDEVLHNIIKQGLIQSFKYTHELAWKVMKDYAFYQGNSSIGGSRDATREALKLNIIKKGEIWMEMIKSRNKTSHTYNEKVANEIYHNIMEDYLDVFLAFQLKMEEKRSGEQQPTP